MILGIRDKMRFENDIVFVITEDLIKILDNCIENAYPNEACGFFFGNIQEINDSGNFKYRYNSEIFQCIESSMSSPASFLMDNDLKLLESNITFKKKDQKLVAIFHSHPTGAHPSSIDKKSMKYYHNCGIKKFTHLVWVIVDSKNKRINGFMYLDNKLNQIRIETRDS